MGKTRRELLRDLGPNGSREITEWMAYSKVEPFGLYQEDFRMAMICSVLANCNRDPKKKKEPYKPEDFIPDYLGARSGGESENGKTQPWQVQKKMCEMLAMALGNQEKERQRKKPLKPKRQAG